jgi:hypothetical protein
MKEQEKQLQRTEPHKEKKLTYFLLFTNKGLILTVSMMILVNLLQRYWIGLVKVLRKTGIQIAGKLHFTLLDDL